MLNVITGVFVESALASDAEEKDVAMVSHLMDFLAGKATAQQGVLSWDEFQEHMKDPAMTLYFKSVDLDAGEAMSLFKLMDTDDDGLVEAEEFVLGCLRLKGNAKAIDLASLMYENQRGFQRLDSQLRRLRKMVDSFAGCESPVANRSFVVPGSQIEVIQCGDSPIVSSQHPPPSSDFNIPGATIVPGSGGAFEPLELSTNSLNTVY